ncbi:hypothetical protein [Nannocystis bainbridge]|uniref:Anaphase-promoting complex subunit 4 WD40 domain-containing protein n=1 Tax=Nannocystis bainbridge TaxID=2995303 RepID=A0ABT5E328_9BACT|nr:hypothetical protein [Nannocystis bainbridge]MDC0720280.1 hypothetical protein [Nannocystis bainbridge]
MNRESGGQGNAERGLASPPVLKCLAWHPDGERAAFGSAEGEVVLVAYPGGARLASQRVFAKGGTTALAFDREGQRLAVGSEKGEIAVLSLAGG